MNLEDDEDTIAANEFIQPRAIYLEKGMTLSNVSSMAVSSDLTHLAVGLDSGNILYYKVIK